MTEARFFTVDDCEIVVRKCLKSDNVRTIDFTIIRLQNQNFLVKITVNHDAEQKTLNFFGKTAPKTPKIVHLLENFKKTIPQFDPKITPKLYYGKPDLLLFEDLTWQGFQSCFGVFSLDHVTVVLKVLAKFHAGNLAYEEIKTKELGEKYRLDREYKLVYGNVNLEEAKVKNLISSQFEDIDQQKILNDLERRQNFCKSRKTLCHSNLVPENIMFKYENEVPIDCKLINFRSKHYAPPIYDILQVIFFNTDEDFRKNHLEEIIIDYHQYLKKELENYCLKIENILTLEEVRVAANHVLPLIKMEAIFRSNERYGTFKEFKKDITCPVLTREDCYVIVKNKMKTSRYKFFSFVVTPLNQTNGYLGDYHKLQVKILHEFEEKTINCFVKCMPKGSTSKEIVQETGCFFKEVFIYHTLVPQMQQLGIDTIDDCLTSCYFQRSEDVVVFDDISLKNYRTLPSTVAFDYQLLSLVVKKLAKFHASMIVFEEKMSEKLGRNYRLDEEYGYHLREIFFLKDETHGGAKVMQTGVRSILDVTNLFPEVKTKANQDNFKKTWPKLEELFFEVIKTSSKFKNVLSHGDLWTNNIMVQFNDDEAIDCCFVDYQCTRYCPPAHDYLSVMYLTTDRSTRAKYEKKLEEIYYNELAQQLSSYSCKIEEILPYEEFLESINYIKPQMVMQAIMYGMFSTCSSEDIASTLSNDELCNRVFFEDRKEYLNKMCEKSLIFRTKLKECILDLYDICDFMSSC